MRILQTPKHYLCLLTTVFLLAVGAANAQQGTKISPALQPNESVDNYTVSADGKYAVYTIGKTVDYDLRRNRLYSVNLASGAVKPLSPELGDYRLVLDYKVSPTSNRVVYRVDRDADNRFELYSTAISGGATSKISILPSNNGDVTEFEISPNGGTVVYEYEEELANYDNVDTLYSVPTAGGTTKRLSPTTPEADVGEFFFTPDSSRVIFEFELPTDDGYSFNSVPVSGGNKVILTAKYYGDSYALTPDSSTFVYIADYEGDDVNELYSVPVKGGTRRRLSLPNEDVKNFKIAPPYSAAVYSYKLTTDDGYSANSFGVTATDGSSRYNLSTGKYTSSFALAANNLGFVFAASDEDYGANKLYSISQQNSGAITEISRPLNPDSYSGVGDFSITPNGSRVVYRFPNEYYSEDLFSVSISGGASVKLNNLSYNQDAGAGSYQITPNSQRVVFPFAAQVYGESGSYDLIFNSVNGGTPTRIANNTDDRYTVTADSRRVVFTRTTYIFDPETYNTTIKTELYSANLPQ